MILQVIGTLSVAAPLLLSDVLATVDERVPQLAAASAEIARAEAELLSSRGAFDPTIAGQIGAYSGKHPRQHGELYLEVPTALGPSVQIGWQVGVGTFPPYALDLQTVEVGEARVQVAVPLLRGLGLGPERAAMLVADRAVDQASALRDDEHLQIRRKAAEAWWRWAGAGARLELDRSLLELALARQAALERQVALGSLAPLDALDHERVVLTRRAAVLEAEQDLAIAGVVLSLWYREADGDPIVPSPTQIPELPAPTAAPIVDDVARALAGRPELLVVDALLDVSRVALRAAGNQRLPELDAVAGATQGLDGQGEPELYVGVELEAPLGQRKARGEQAEARAAIARLVAERRALVDRIAVEVASARTARDTAAQRAETLTVAAERAREVARLEERAFALGASDLFRVLAREAALADAAREAVDGRIAWGLADAGWQAAVGLAADEP